MKPSPAFQYPNRMGRVLHLAMEEILGQAGVEAVVAAANEGQAEAGQVPAFHARRLQPALERLYGVPAGRGLAVRIGRVCFKHCLRELGPGLGLSGADFRILPLAARLLKGNEAFAALFHMFTDQAVSLEQSDNKLTWTIDPYPQTSAGGLDGPVCMLAVGLLQEAFYWVSAGKTYQVEANKAAACGDPACTIVISRTPMG